MKIPLDIPRGNKQRDFLDYLNAAIRSRMTTYNGSYGIDGRLFRSRIAGPFKVDQQTFPLEWTITQDLQGTITELSVASTHPDVPESSWSSAAYEFITSVLATTLTEQKQVFFRRQQYYYIGPQLDGEYWFPGYRFAPIYPDDEMPALLNAERVVVIDQSIQAIDDMHAHTIAAEAAARHAARLSLLLNVGLTKPEGAMRWVIPEMEEGQVRESIRCHLGFHKPELNTHSMPRKAEICPPGKYSGSLTARYRVAGELQSLPPEARRIFRGVDHADPLVTNAFDCGARLYQVALVCGRFFPSIGLAYRVAAIEAISEADPDCDGFSQFMRKHVKSQGNLEYIIEYLYGNVRSAHFHAGAFPLGEFVSQRYFDAFREFDRMEADVLHRVCFEVTREAIVNWMIDQVPDNENGQ